MLSQSLVQIRIQQRLMGLSDLAEGGKHLLGSGPLINRIHCIFQRVVVEILYSLHSKSCYCFYFLENVPSLPKFLNYRIVLSSFCQLSDLSLILA